MTRTRGRLAARRCGRWLLMVCCAGFAAAGASAADPPVLDAAAVPGLNDRGRASYANFLMVNTPRAFAMSPSGSAGWQGGTGTIEDVRAKALANCASKGATDCELYAEDLQVVWRGRKPAELAKPSGPIKTGRDYTFTYDERYFWHGPGSARGVYVWGHGKGAGQDSREAQAQSYVRVFNNAGFDVIRFTRAPFPDDVNDAAAFLRQGLAELRTQGWRKIVVGGQSRGGWNSLQVLDTPGLADAVIAVSPGNHRTENQQKADLWSVLHNVKARETRVAVVHLTGDDYVREPDERVAAVREQLGPRVNHLLVIDRPAGIAGHGGGNTAVFAQRFGACLLRFVTEPVPLPACPEAKPQP
jgi:pimeloyl-ACP methyl ester carboxylesterase